MQFSVDNVTLAPTHNASPQDYFGGLVISATFQLGSQTYIGSGGYAYVYYNDAIYGDGIAFHLELTGAPWSEIGVEGRDYTDTAYSSLPTTLPDFPYPSSAANSGWPTDVFGGIGDASFYARLVAFSEVTVNGSNPGSIPEPASFALLSAALAGFGVARRYRSGAWS